MNENISKLQTKLDETKNQLALIEEYATLSGLNMLPRNWVVSPYIKSIQTGIKEQVNSEEQVTSFELEFNIRVKKHNIDEKPCLCESNSFLKTSYLIPSGNWKNFAEYSEEEKLSIATQSKIGEYIEEHAIKQAECDFFGSILQYFKQES